MGSHRRTQAMRHSTRQGDRIAFDHEVQIVEVSPPEQRIADHSADDAHLARQMGTQARQHRVRQELVCQMSTIHRVSWDPLSEKLIENSPLRNPELVASFSRYQHLTIRELDAAWDQVNVAFREWVEQPGNAGRPIQQAPQYWDRIAIDSLRERRTWWE
jgi:hypothetical protein